MANHNNHQVHHPARLFTDHTASVHRAILILNQPIPSRSLLETLWQTCSYRICADGGANRLHDILKNATSKENENLLPTAIHGDMDSISEEAQEFFTRLGVPVTKDPDQYSTDFGKCMKKIRERSMEVKASSEDGRGITDVVVLGGLSGRVDHALGMLGEMGREMGLTSSGEAADEEAQNMTLTLVSPTAVTFWIRPLPVMNEIWVPLERLYTAVESERSRMSLRFKPNAGIVPLYKPARLTIEGFEWDVKDWETDMFGNVSTSNHIIPRDCSKDGRVKICATEPMVFTVELNIDGLD